MPGCCNYDTAHGGCLFDEFCRVERGQRCPWFERAVLPTAVDTSQKEHIYSLYEAHVGLDAPLVREDLRLCPDCGQVELKPRQRYCPNCARKRRREANRRHQAKHRRKVG